MQKTVEDLPLFVQGFLLHCRSQGRSPNTVNFYRRNLEKFQWWLRETGRPASLDQIDTNTLREFMAYLQEAPARWGSDVPTARRPLNTGGVHSYGRALKAFFAWTAVETGVDSPMASVKLPRLPNQWKVETWNAQEIAQLYAAASSSHSYFLSVRDRTIFSVLLDSGMRAGELLSLKVDDVSIEGGGFQVKGKGGRRRTVLLGTFTRKELWNYMRERIKRPGEALFITAFNKPLVYTGLRQLFERLKARTGITRVGVHPHIARHTAATLMHRNGMSGASLQEIMGHSQFTTTKRYYLDIEAQDLAEEHSKYGPVDNLGLSESRIDSKARKLPAAHILAREVSNSSYRAVGRRYGVSDNTVRNHLKRAGLL